MMNKKLTLLLILVMCAGSVTRAKQVTETQARALAEQFFNTSLPVQAPAMKAKARGAATAPFYVYNNPEQPGWVIIAGDDRAREVLAYGDEFYFDESEMPECVQDWLESYAEQIANLDNAQQAAPLTTTSVAAGGGKARISPMLSCNMAQGLPFNQQCPPATVGGTNYCVAGCVAIAMAQIMYYYRSSTATTSIPAYKSVKLNRDMPELPATTFNYSLMNDWYDKATNTSAGAQEVAKLVKYCAQSVNMDFGESVSSATSQVNAFVKYFGYDKDATQVNREDVTAAEWENLVYTELSAGRPVYISARKSSGGHAFVCDGYNGSGLYHINWGWRGHQNGYFALNALTDDNAGGTGAASGSEGYTLKMMIMVGLQPSTGSTSSTSGNTVKLYKPCEATTTSYTRSSSSQNFTGVELIAYYWNNSDQAYTYDLGWGLYDSNDNLVSTHIVSSGKNLNPTYYTWPVGSINVGKNVTGTYYLKPICRLSGTSQFHPCRGTGHNYIKATITATSMQLKVYDPLTVQNLKINSVTTGSIKKVGSPMELKLGVSNQGLTDYSYIYMWEGDVLKSATTTDIAPGASGTVVMSITPSEAGTKKYTFTADADGTKTLFTTNITVQSATAATISGTTLSSVDGTTFNASITVKNENTNTYNDYIIAKLYKKEPNSGNTGYFCCSQSQTVYLGHNNTTTLNYAFTNLDFDETYFVIFYCISNGEQVRINATSSRKVESPFDRLDVNQDGSVTGSDVTAVYNTIFGVTNRYHRWADTNGDGEVTGSDITAIYNKILGL